MKFTTSPQSDQNKNSTHLPNDVDVDDFCKDIIAWKVAATKKDEIFELFKEKPSYFFGFLIYQLRQNEKRNSKIQVATLILSISSLFLAFTAIGMTFYQSIGKPEFPFIAALFLIAAIVILCIGSKLPRIFD